jgi:hypothetical protein
MENPQDDPFTIWKNHQVPVRASGLFNEDDFDYALELSPDDEYRYCGFSCCFFSY